MQIIVNTGSNVDGTERIAGALETIVEDALSRYRERLTRVEVHLSDVESREDWRGISVFEGMVLARVSGKGPDGYREALEILARELKVR